MRKNADKLVPVLIGKEESYYSLNSANWGRNVNLELGCQSVDGRVILPAEYFSWCQHGGSGSKADGYQLATVFSSTGYDYGGGLCQVTTTLASAADYAKMYLAEVYVHSQPVTYLRPGMREASIWRNGNILYQHDFAFFNNRMNPIQIRMKAENGVVTAELYELVLLPARRNPQRRNRLPLRRRQPRLGKKPHRRKQHKQRMKHRNEIGIVERQRPEGLSGKGIS